MYKVLIVEDEAIIRNGLAYSIDWEKLGCSLVATAENGEVGALKILKYLPDIVITDINMPIKNGLEMIDETLNQHVYSVIVLSGYSDLEYMRKSIHYGVCEYLLKPLNDIELKNAIYKAIQQVKEKSYYKEIINKKQNIEEIDLLKCIDIRNEDITNRIIGYIHQEYHQKITMSILVEKLHYSESILNKRFKEATGHTINDYLNRYRIQKAIQLMYEKRSIQDVAQLTGFNDLKYFSVVFKKYIGHSPKEFIKLTLI